MLLAVIFLPALMPVLMLVIVLLNMLEKRRTALRLDWPDNITFKAMTSRFKHYMLRHGWKVRASDDIVYQFVVNKDDEDFVVYCSQADPIYFSRAILDITGAKRRFGGKPVLFVVTKPAPAHLVGSAYDDGIYIVRHTQLGDVTGMGRSSTKRLRKLVRDLNGLGDK